MVKLQIMNIMKAIVLFILFVLYSSGINAQNGYFITLYDEPDVNIGVGNNNERPSITVEDDGENINIYSDIIINKV